MQNKKRVIEIRRVIEYHQFFEKEKPIDVVATLKQFNRHKLIRMATVLSLFYGNLHIPDSKRTLFSNCSQKYIEYLNHCFDIYLEKINCQPGQKVELVTYRTTLELWRHIFAIKAGEYQNIVKDEDAELLFFKVILTLNEKVVYIKESDKKKFELDELLFLSSFLTNDLNNYNFQVVLQPQLYYFYCFVNAIEKDKMLTAASNTLLKNGVLLLGDNIWQPFYISLRKLKIIELATNVGPLYSIPMLYWNMIKPGCFLLLL